MLEDEQRLRSPNFIFSWLSGRGRGRGAFQSGRTAGSRGRGSVRARARGRGRGRTQRRPAEKSANDLDKELETYHAEAMNTS